ncbi:unnamed protein product [Cyprideis torosa]|uniref:Uncharacterized protein n=1 Tax=Cyprideis torosa TaxID=163714 RepID=A0A7R8WAB0_9CRUS|nr:unnamed protein product [Cyprideis torosa]CAG0890804.1 unnamed protein product [Cyprideis torosa]
MVLRVSYADGAQSHGRANLLLPQRHAPTTHPALTASPLLVLIRNIVPVARRHGIQFRNLCDDFKMTSTEATESTEQPEVPCISYNDLLAKVSDPVSSCVLIDVREHKELQETGKLPRSVCIPLPDFPQAFLQSEEDFQKKYGITKPLQSGEGSECVFTCRSGRRAEDAIRKLLPFGYKNLWLYKGSYLEWKEKGGPIEDYTCPNEEPSGAAS